MIIRNRMQWGKADNKKTTKQKTGQVKNKEAQIISFKNQRQR